MTPSAKEPRTPRSDTAQFSTYDGFAKRAPTIRVVRVEVARELERENAALRAMLLKLVASRVTNQTLTEARALLAGPGKEATPGRP